MLFESNFFWRFLLTRCGETSWLKSKPVLQQHGKIHPRGVTMWPTWMAVNGKHASTLPSWYEHACLWCPGCRYCCCRRGSWQNMSNTMLCGKILMASNNAVWHTGPQWNASISFTHHIHMDFYNFSRHPSLDMFDNHCIKCKVSSSCTSSKTNKWSI